MKIKSLFSILFILLTSTTILLSQNRKEPPSTMTHDDWIYSGKVPHRYEANGYDITFYNNKISSEGLEIDGKKNGIWISYYPNGKVESIIGYWYGMPEGVWKTFYPNGQLKEEGYHFREEAPNYTTISEYDRILNDSIWKITITNDSKFKHGTWNKYDSTGILLESVTYRKGKIEKPSDKTIFKIDMSYWQGCEEHYDEEQCQPLEFERQNIQDEIVLITPCCGKSTEVILYKESSNIQIKKRNTSLSNCPPELNLTGLPDGKYSIETSNCPIYKRAKFLLITNQK